jgi:hypothetical protein
MQNAYRRLTSFWKNAHVFCPWTMPAKAEYWRSRQTPE